MKKPNKSKKELFDLKVKAHEHLDRLWKDKIFTRSEVYEMLKIVFRKEVHIAQADEKMCREIIKKLTVLKRLKKPKVSPLTPTK